MTIQVNLSEQHYWILTQAVSAAGTASHRHGMERHDGENEYKMLKWIAGQS